MPPLHPETPPSRFRSVPQAGPNRAPPARPNRVPGTKKTVPSANSRTCATGANGPRPPGCASSVAGSSRSRLRERKTAVTATISPKKSRGNGAACHSGALPVPKRIAPCVIAERLRQHAVKALLAGIAELIDADGHADMAGLRLVAVGSEQAIPPGQVEAEVAVGLARLDRVVDPVHVRGHDDPAQNAVEPRGQRARCRG